MNALDKHFGKQTISALTVMSAERKLRRGNKRAVIVAKDGSLSVNCAHQRYDERLGVQAEHVDLRSFTRCKRGRKAGTPIIRKL